MFMRHWLSPSPPASWHLTYRMVVEDSPVSISFWTLGSLRASSSVMCGSAHLTPDT